MQEINELEEELQAALKTIRKQTGCAYMFHFVMWARFRTFLQAGCNLLA